MGCANPCPLPPFLQTACGAPVDAISDYCQLMCQPEANQKLWGFVWTMWVENPSDYLLLFYDSLMGAGVAMDNDIATVHPTPDKAAGLHTLNCCRRDSRKSCPSLHESRCPSWRHQRSSWMCRAIRKWSFPPSALKLSVGKMEGSRVRDCFIS